jgi:uroporphyrinogen-III synthase
VRLLVTRPEPDGERTAATLRARGHEVTLAPLLRVEPIPDAQISDGPWSALVLTSANALAAIAVHPRRGELLALPVHAVGRRTAAAARAAGFADVTAGGATVQELIAHLRQAHSRQVFAGGRASLLYLAGEDRSHDLGQELAPHGLAVRTVVVYRAVKAAAFSPTVAAALAGGAIDGVLHFSRRSTEAYVGCVRAAGLLGKSMSLVHYCLSGQVAEPLAASAGEVRIATRPDEAALIALIETAASPN